MIKPINIPVTDSNTFVFEYKPQWETDTLGVSDSVDHVISADATSSFFVEGPIIMEHLVRPNYHSDLITFIILALLTGIAIIWYFLPERLTQLFSFSDKNKYSKHRQQSIVVAPGAIILSFFQLNYVVTTIIFIYVSLKILAPHLLLIFSELEIFIVIGGSVSLILIYRLLVIKLGGYFFNTQAAANRQIKLYINTDNVFGLVLLPLLLLLLYPIIPGVIYLGILLILISLLFRWYHIFLIGKKLDDFSLFHLFIYLCTLEIIPLLVLIKLLLTWL